MSNVRKHASARLAQVSLLRQADELILSIHDDGVGFNPWQRAGEPYAHFGLQTMQERGESIGAKLQVESEPGQGTTVTVTLKIGEI
jgi:two-component system nitrate/nitrite sensor histidine kinase NarX